MKIKLPNKLRSTMIIMLILSMMNVGLTGFTVKADTITTEKDPPIMVASDNDDQNNQRDTQLLSKEIITENNPLKIVVEEVNYSNDISDDHLEITLVNTGNKTLTDFNIYFLITDPIDLAVETYYEMLNDLSINPGQSKTIYFDNKINQKNHYSFKSNGLYGDSPNPSTLDIVLQARGYAPLSFSLDK